MTLRRHGLPRRAVPAAFDAGAAGYDKLVAANPGYHQHLRSSARGLNLDDGGAGMRLLDAGCGTGASTAALMSVAGRADIVAVEASQYMLRQARTKSWPSSVQFVHSRIENVHDAGVRGPFDGIFAAYLVRNLTCPEEQLRAFRHLLKPGGVLVVHEYSVRDSVRARAVWHAVCWGIIIPAGFVITGDSVLYRHLWRSVAAFDGAHRFQRRLSDCGFTDVRQRTMTGWQREVVHTFLATAPAT